MFDALKARINEIQSQNQKYRDARKIIEFCKESPQRFVTASLDDELLATWRRIEGEVEMVEGPNFQKAIQTTPKKILVTFYEKEGQVSRGRGKKGFLQFSLRNDK